MQVNVNVAPSILRWVMENTHMDTLPEQVAAWLLAWNNGDKRPTYNQIEKVSQTTGIPLGYFFLQTPPIEKTPLLEYRTVDSQKLMEPSQELLDTIHDMDQIREWTKKYLIAENGSPLDFVGKLKNIGEIYDAADTVRRLLDIPKDWFKTRKSAEDSFRFLRARISDLGVLVMMSGIVGNNTHRTLDIGEFRAFAIVDEHAPLIFINTNDSTNARLFSLMHEFIHICIGEDDLYNDRDSTANGIKQIETFCNAVTAEILVPADMFIAAWAENASNYEPKESIEYIARNFRCGTTVIARKALDKGYISQSAYREIARHAVECYNELRSRNKEQGTGGGDYYRTAASRIDRRFFAMLFDSVSTGNTLYSDAYRLTNTNRGTFRKLAEAQMGGNVL